MDRDNLLDLINNIENGTLADAEQIFNDIMDLKAGEIVNSKREELAQTLFSDEPAYTADEESFEEE